MSNKAAKRYSPPPPQTVEAREMDQGNRQEDISTFFLFKYLFVFSFSERLDYYRKGLVPFQ